MGIAERTGVRPSFWVGALVVLAGIAAAVAFVLENDPLATARAERAAADREGDERDGRRDGGRGGRRLSLSSGGPSGGAGYEHHDWSAESELSRRIALGLPQASFWREPPARELEQDPQLAAMYRSFQSRRDAESDAPPLPFEPLAHRADLIEAEGELSMSPTSCDVRVLPVDSSGFNCLVRVMCDGAVLYPHPGQDAGYVPCDLENGRPVRALDGMYSDRDGDPSVDLDLARGTVTVEEFGPDGQRRYRATLRINNS